MERLILLAIVAGVLTGGLLAVVGAGLLLARRRSGRAGGDVDRHHTRTSAITTDENDPRGGLARKGLDSLRAGVVILDPSDQPVLVNRSARAMNLLRAGTGPGMVAAHPVVRTLAAQVRRSGVRREVELDLPGGGDTGSDDDPLGVLLRGVGLGGGVVAVEAADVTESHRVARVRRDFVANVGHELKTPIGALQLLSEALLDATDPREAAAADPTDAAATRRFAERIQQESTRLGRLVNELLELSRVQGAEPLPEREPVAVDWLTSEVLERARTAAAAGRVEITVTGARGLTVYGSDRQLATALSNLVDNAVAYSPGGSSVEIHCRAEDDQVAISVTDQGIGIAESEVDRVFERFYRSDQARSRATGGTGLGLAIVKHVATNHGGRVEVASVLGEGSTFTLRLPARPPEAAATLPAGDGIETSERTRDTPAALAGGGG